MLWGLGLLLLAASPSEAASITLIATADGEVSDQQMADGTQIKDGIFETVNANDDFLQIRFNKFEFTTHGAFEFDLGALPDNAIITSAAFVFSRPAPAAGIGDAGSEPSRRSR